MKISCSVKEVSTISSLEISFFTPYYSSVQNESRYGAKEQHVTVNSRVRIQQFTSINYVKRVR